MGGTSSKPTETGIAGRSRAITGGGAGQKGKQGLPKLPADAVKAQPENYNLLEVGWQLWSCAWYLYLCKHKRASLNSTAAQVPPVTPLSAGMSGQAPALQQAGCAAAAEDCAGDV
jgi:hypothetical protein